MNRLEVRLARLEADAGIVEHDCRPHALVRIIVDPQLGAIGEMRRIVPCPVCGKGERYDAPYVGYDTPRTRQRAAKS